MEGMMAKGSFDTAVHGLDLVQGLEPGSIALLAVALFAFAALRRRFWFSVASVRPLSSPAKARLLAQNQGSTVKLS